MSEFMIKREEKLNKMRDLLIRMDKGDITPQEVKEKFKEVLNDISPAEIAIIENTLITKDGFPAEKIHKLCDVHIDIFRETLEREELVVNDGNPLKLLLSEHKEILKNLGNLKTIATELKESRNIQDNITKIRAEFQLLKGLENHMLREENALFPFLEIHEVVQPPQILWTEHDSIRSRIKELEDILDRDDEELKSFDFLSNLYPLIVYIVDLKSNHIYKENKILFPTALQKLTKDEWMKVTKSMLDIGFAAITPKEEVEKLNLEKKTELSSDEEIKLGFGGLTVSELKLVLDTLPVEFTFVDKDDRVKYFNRGDKRIFVRTEAVVGRSVQNCHPPKSVHIVNNILKDFKEGKRNKADFWINLQGKFVYIRYFAVRDEAGNYIGTLEVTQDVTEIRELQGERRIYSEEEKNNKT